ncbi:DUF3052 domain-containing protein [Streptomyces sp. NPDC058855]|uniref:DUF3052 domain-containing protein n=1 Tax=Streptomyces sp. NPDC058855 TaxID=3346651 RepID=UPI0036CF9260
MTTAETSMADRLGFTQGQTVREIGHAQDSDADLRQSVEELTGKELVGVGTGGVADAVLMWWRDDDGDLVDGLLDALTDLSEDGVVWLLTPKTGRVGHVEPSDIAEGAATAGLVQTSSVRAAVDWQGTELRTPKARRSGRGA